MMSHYEILDECVSCGGYCACAHEIDNSELITQIARDTEAADFARALRELAHVNYRLAHLMHEIRQLESR